MRNQCYLCNMARSLIVRNVDDELVRRLKMRAARHNRSAEAEHRDILRQALGGEPARGARRGGGAPPAADARTRAYAIGAAPAREPGRAVSGFVVDASVAINGSSRARHRGAAHSYASLSAPDLLAPECANILERLTRAELSAGRSQVSPSPWRELRARAPEPIPSDHDRIAWNSDARRSDCFYLALTETLSSRSSLPTLRLCISAQSI